MASSKEYLQFILEQLSDLEEINYRAMMGEYIIYYRGRIVGGIYDDRLLRNRQNLQFLIWQLRFMNYRMKGQRRCC